MRPASVSDRDREISRARLSEVKSGEEEEEGGRGGGVAQKKKSRYEMLHRVYIV